MDFKASEAAKAVGGKLCGGDVTIKGVAIDNRKISAGFLFIPIKGERFDGHDFIASAYENGAVCCFTEKLLDTEKPYIQVNDTAEAFQALAGWYKSLFDVITIGITGSVGKTTTKEMLYCALSQKFNVMKSAGNLNNQTGVPQTLFTLEKEHEAAIVEMGTNHFGEIERLAKMVRPNYCLLTNIGDSHIEHLGSREGILKAKSEMFPYMKNGGKIFINGDDELLRTVKEQRSDCVSYGSAEGCDFTAKAVESKGLEGSFFTACHNGDETRIFVPAPGAHMVQNAIAAFAVGTTLGMDAELIKAGIESYAPVSGRLCIEKCGEMTIINDVYNANPSSVKASLSVLKEAEGRTVCILGDMLELGENSPEYHAQVGAFAAEAGIGVIACVGELSRETALAASRAGAKTFYYETQDELITMLKKFIKRSDTVLVKASRGMALERMAEALKKLFDKK